MPLACKLCILTKGLKGSEVADLPQNEEELAQHMEREHHVIVRRENETLEDSFRRVIANPDTCPECRASAEDQLAAL